jgi:hypothetical protein
MRGKLSDCLLLRTATRGDGSLTAKRFTSGDEGTRVFRYQYPRLLRRYSRRGEAGAAGLSTRRALSGQFCRDNSLVVSLQVLQEYYATTKRKLKVYPLVAQTKVEAFARGRVVRFTERDLIAAIELHRLTRISSMLAGVTVRNPFAGA